MCIRDSLLIEREKLDRTDFENFMTGKLLSEPQARTESESTSSDAPDAAQL